MKIFAIIIFALSNFVFACVECILCVCVYECKTQHVCVPSSERTSSLRTKKRNETFIRMQIFLEVQFSAMFFVQNIAMQPSIVEYRIYVYRKFEYSGTTRIDFFIFKYVNNLGMFTTI